MNKPYTILTSILALAFIVFPMGLAIRAMFLDSFIFMDGYRFLGSVEIIGWGEWVVGGVFVVAMTIGYVVTGAILECSSKE